MEVCYRLEMPDTVQNSPLVDRQAFIEEAKNEIDQVFALYKIKAQPAEGGDKGGGFDGLWAMLKILWENKEIIQIVLAIAGGFWRLIKLQRGWYLEKSIRNSRPRFIMSVCIIDNDKYLEDEIPRWIADYLVNLKFVTDEITGRLSEKFPLFVFDQSISLWIPAKNVSHNYYFSHENQNRHSLARFIKICKGLPFFINRTIDHNFKWLIHRRDSYLSNQKSKVYWFFLSNWILSDWKVKIIYALKTL
jgi:hypothetical protein